MEADPPQQNNPSGWKLLLSDIAHEGRKAIENEAARASGEWQERGKKAKEVFAMVAAVLVAVFLGLMFISLALGFLLAASLGYPLAFTIVAIIWFTLAILLALLARGHQAKTQGNS